MFSKFVAPVFSALLAVAILPEPAFAQRADENAVTDADDAFGNNVGLESTGIYTDRNTRGFSPLDAGNVRFDGIYFDQVSVMSGRIRKSTAIRVGFSAVNFPFVAPTGVSDIAVAPFPTEAGNSVALTRYFYGGHLQEWDLRLPLVEDHVALTGGFANASTRFVDGANWESWGVTIRPIFRYGGVEFAPFAAVGNFAGADARPLVVVSEGKLPPQPGRRQYLAQEWAEGTNQHQNLGATLKARITDRISTRSGIFYSMADRDENYTEIYRIRDETGLADHLLFADPPHEKDSLSGEALVGIRLGNARNVHRIFGGYRFRNRLTETGGSDFINFTEFEPVVYGLLDPQPEPDFAFTDPNRGRVKQSSWMIGYMGHINGRLHVNAGLQKARYRATSLVGATGVIDRSSANPWLYNATAMFDVSRMFSVYLGTQRGLEDSGLAPENATNRNEQLPATKTTQYEGGVKLNFGKNHLILAAFEITKPYFTFDAARNFVPLGTRTHRGIEASFTGHFNDRFDLLAGVSLVDAKVSGEARDQGLVGKRPPGTPNVYAQLDANYRTDLLGGLVVTGSLHYTGKRAVTSSPIADLGNRQLNLPGFLRVDLGLRHRFKVGDNDLSVRTVVQNVFDEKNWYVASSDVLFPEDRRRMLAVLAVDF